MIRGGFACNFNDIREELRMFPELHDIIKRYRENFEGPPIDRRKSSYSTSHASKMP